ncbi:MAG: hypothetical protein ACRC4G_05545, partial [Alphaproteobacteria bacterium]
FFQKIRLRVPAPLYLHAQAYSPFRTVNGNARLNRRLRQHPPIACLGSAKGTNPRKISSQPALNQPPPPLGGKKTCLYHDLSEVMTILVLFHLSHYRTFKDFFI